MDSITWGGIEMIRTIIIGSCVSIQGIYVRTLTNGKIQVKVGPVAYKGYPV